MAPMSTTRPNPTTRFLTVAAAVATIVATLTIPTDATATMMRYADVDRLVDISDVIVHATVTDRQTVIDDERRPWTETTVDVHHSFRGPETDELVFHQWGADDGPRTGRIAGDPRLDVGQKAVLFLRRDTARDGLSLAALAQSVFYVERQDERRLVRRDLSDLALVAPGDEDTAVVRYDEPPHEWSIFVAVLESLIAQREE